MFGDFNAKLDKREDDNEIPLGFHGIGERNERGDLLLLKTVEQRKWTWISTFGSTKNEIDFIITDKNKSLLMSPC